MTVIEVGNNSDWSWDQDKAFENGLAIYLEGSCDRWVKIAADVGKTLEEIKEHYGRLEDDINRINLGCVPLPPYDSSDDSAGHAGGVTSGKKGSSKLGIYKSESSKKSRSDQERRKGIPWTEDEHKLFLAGLEKYGKGEWRSISRNYVVTRTPTQVASHAQKFYIRNSMNNNDRRRSSIHNIISVGDGEVSPPQLMTISPPQGLITISPPQGPITGQSNGAAAEGWTGVGMYGVPTIGQPIGGPFVSAVGTPANLPTPPHMGYGVRAPAPGEVLPGAPINMGPMMYPTPHTETITPAPGEVLPGALMNMGPLMYPMLHTKNKTPAPGGVVPGALMNMGPLMYPVLHTKNKTPVQRTQVD